MMNSSIKVLIAIIILATIPTAETAIFLSSAYNNLIPTGGGVLGDPRGIWGWPRGRPRTMSGRGSCA
jgi:hypothetical protein